MKIVEAVTKAVNQGDDSLWTMKFPAKEYKPHVANVMTDLTTDEKEFWYARLKLRVYGELKYA